MKRRHHYVFQAYLKGWCKTKKVCCLRDNKCVETSTVNICQERDFYKTKPLNKEEFEMLRILFIDSQPALLKKHFLDHINDYLLPLRQKEHNNIAVTNLSKQNLNSSLKQILEKEGRKIDIEIHEYNENIYSNIESKGIEFIRKLLLKDNLFYYDNSSDLEVYKQEKFQFLLFITTQYYRTKAYRDRLKLHLIENPPPSSVASSNILNKINIENLFPHIIWIYETKMAFCLYKAMAPLTILENKTTTSFLTCDQPIINLYADYKNPKIQTKLVFYYPLSPKIAILINSDMKGNIYEVSEEEVRSYNKAIVNASYEFIIANNKKDLEQIRDSTYTTETNFKKLEK